MIKTLFIRNYALLDNVDIDFTNGLTVISGETGSGKSIMLDAISLLLGNRVLRFDSVKQSSKSIIEGVFYISNDNKDFFKKNNLDFEEETIIRREIAPNGKSRAFINDTPVRLNILSLLGKRIMEVYDQNHSLFSTNEDFQFEFINHMSDSLKLLNDYNIHLNKLNELKKDLQIINDQGSLSTAEIEFLQYQYDELNDVNIQKNEKDELEKELSLLENIDDIADAISESDVLLNNEKGILECLNLIKRKLIDFDNFSDLHSRIDSVIIELNDFSNSLAHINNDLDLNPRRLVDLNHRLDLINSLMLKHRVNSSEELIELKNDFQSRIELSRSFNDLLDQKKAEIMLSQEKVTKTANILNINRNKIIPQVVSEVQNILMQLGMPHARFDIRMDVKEGYNKNGNTSIEFYFSANKGRRMQEISKVASGGELSRLMLAIKYLSAKKSQINTLVFDEIDSGVSGQVASLMGDMMVDMSQSAQLISISHLPQIAAKANTHFKVFKNISNDKASSEIIKLSEKERVNEIAKLLSGKRLTQAAIDNAIDLLNQ